MQIRPDLVGKGANPKYMHFPASADLVRRILIPMHVQGQEPAMLRISAIIMLHLQMASLLEENVRHLSEDAKVEL